LRLSPDGKKLAYRAQANRPSDIWVDELERGVRTPLTNDPGSGYTSPTWSPDGSRILFGGGKDNAGSGIYQMNSNGAGVKELLLGEDTPDLGIFPTSWSPDARFILYVRAEIPLTPMRQEVWVLRVGDRKPRLFVQHAFDGQFSPDGRWVAYTEFNSTDLGKNQICVVPFDATKVLDTEPGAVTSLTGKYQISASWGAIARWRGDGKEIFYYGQGGMMAAEVDGRGNSFVAREEQALFKFPEGSGWYDVASNGKRFVTSREVKNPNTPLTLVVNWTALLANKP